MWKQILGDDDHDDDEEEEENKEKEEDDRGDGLGFEAGTKYDFMTMMKVNDRPSTSRWYS
jgi:hypothetical protein